MRIVFVYVVVTLAVIMLVSCNPVTTAATYIPESTSIELVDKDLSSVLILTYYELTQFSDIVVMGHVRAEVGVINTARNHTDNSQPDPRFFTVAVVYAIDVEEYLAGDGPRTIYLAQWEGSIDHGATPSPAEIDQARAASVSDVYNSFELHKTYLMFLRPIEVWEDYGIVELEEGNLFVRTANPWLFDASDPLNVFVVALTSGIEQIYPPQPLAEIIAQMNDPIRLPPLDAYPVPLESPLEQFQPTIPPSYPAP